MSDVNSKMILTASLGTLLLSASLSVVLFTGGDDALGGNEEVALAGTSHFKPSQTKTLTSVCGDCAEAEPDAEGAEPTGEPAGPASDGGAGEANEEGLVAAQEVATRAAPLQQGTDHGAPGANEEQAVEPEDEEQQPQPAQDEQGEPTARDEPDADAPAPYAMPQTPSAPVAPAVPPAPAQPDVSYEIEAPDRERPQAPDAPDAPNAPDAPDQRDPPADPPREEEDANESDGERFWIEAEQNVSVEVPSVETPGVPSQRYDTPVVETPATCTIALCHEGHAIEPQTFQTPDVGGEDVGTEGAHLNETSVGPFGTIGPYDLPPQHLLTTPDAPAANVTTPPARLHPVCSYGAKACLDAHSFGPYVITTPHVPSLRTYGLLIWIAYEAYVGLDENGQPDGGASIGPGFDTL